MGDELAELRKLTGQLQKLTYAAVKSGTMAELSDEEQLFARAMQEHMHLKHVHNALEFADVREGAPYEVEFEGNVVSPLAHVAMHAAVKGQIEQVPEVKKGATKAKARYDRSIQKLCEDSTFREKMLKRFGGSHPAFE